jgi:hypothetical protein
MSDVNGIPNLGFMGGQTGTLGGIPNLQPALSAAQINASMGLPGAAYQNQAALNQNFNNFGQQTDYYSQLGAAYGRQTGGFGSSPMVDALMGVPGGQSTDGMDPGMPTFDDRWSGAQPDYNAWYNATGAGAGDGLPNFAERWGVMQQSAPGASFNDRWSGMPTHQGQTAVDAVSGGWGGTPTTGTAPPPTGGYDPLDPNSTPTPQFVNNGPGGTPWWQQTTNPAMDDALARFRAGQGWTVGAQPVGNDPSLAQNINQAIWDIGQVSTPNMFIGQEPWRTAGDNGTLGHMSGTGGYYSEFAPPPGQDASRFDTSGFYGAQPMPGASQGMGPGFGGFDNGWQANQFDNRFTAGGPGYSNMDPSQYYAGQGFRSQNTGILQGPAQMPPGFTPRYSLENPNGMVTSPYNNTPFFSMGNGGV